MNKNKGFALLETLIVSTLVLGTLVFFYVQLTNLKTNYDISFKYNTVPGLYKANEVKKFLTENGYSNLEDLLKTNIYIDINNSSLVYGDSELYKNLLIELNIDKILFTYNDLADIKKYLMGEYNKATFDEEFKRFVTNLSTNKNGKYRFIIKYNDNTFASIAIGSGLKYENGTAVYFDPVSGKVCENYVSTNSNTGVKTGCMKWYIFNDNYGRDTVDMILDHNTTAAVAWNSTGEINSGPKELLVQLKEDTKSWSGIETRSDQYSLDNGLIKYKIDYTGYKARVFSANEIAKITGNYNWEETSTTNSPGYYLDTNDLTVPDFTGNKKSIYSWLYNYTKDCLVAGCDFEDNSTYAYWSSTAVAREEYKNAWYIHTGGRVGGNTVSINSGIGIRPVITINNSVLR